MKKILPYILGILALGLLLVGQIFESENSEIDKKRFSEKVNLALRQTGDQLLRIQCDETSTIPPIREISENEFVLKIESALNYDTLPWVLAEALTSFGIEEEYGVTIKDCNSDTLLLGYNFSAFRQGSVACKGREYVASCSFISLVFWNKKTAAGTNYSSILGFLLIGLTLFLQFFFYKKRKKETPPPTLKNNSFLKVGNSEFDFSNQTISVNGKKKSLTFRENKLLLFFANNQNQVLEREKIMSNVWEDEGVIVGRSLDVFVSRLRKILKEDESVQLKNVHGVGYRMEVLS